jgi:hypothetical protein
MSRTPQVSEAKHQACHLPTPCNQVNSTGAPGRRSCAPDWTLIAANKFAATQIALIILNAASREKALLHVAVCLPDIAMRSSCLKCRRTDLQLCNARMPSVRTRSAMKLEKRDEAWEHLADPSRDALDKFVRHP